MPHVQYAVRNVFVFDNSGTTPILVAGCRQFGNMTKTEFYSCLSICFDQPVSGEFRLLDESNNIVPNDDSVLLPGNFFMISTVNPITYIPVVLTAETPRPRIISGGSPATATVTTLIVFFD